MTVSVSRRPPIFRWLAGLLAALLLVRGAVAAQPVSASALNQIDSLLAEKAARTPAQQKMDSQLVYFAKQNSHLAITAAVPKLDVKVDADANGSVLVDLKATVSQDLFDFIAKSGGTIRSAFPQWKAVRARVPIGAVEALAARDDVQFVEPAAEATTNTGPVTWEGDRTHRADAARAGYATNGGSGIKIGVLSDGSAAVPNSILAGELNPDTTILPGQGGGATANEGTAMMEIVQDIVPNAKLYFATAFNGTASFAANIIALRDAGCTVIVDDVTYLNESPFQDQVIAQAVNTVSASGVMYFSSARNSGSLLKNTSGTWEGDFADGGAATAPLATSYHLHDFGGGTLYDTVLSGGSSRRVDLFWADPLGASANDYDLFVLDATGATVLRSSTNVQSGSQDPYESVGTLNAGERIVIAQKPGAAPRFLHLDTGRAYLMIATAGNVRGHNATVAANGFSVAAVAVTTAPSGATPPYFTGGGTNPVEYFSSDGPRRMFFNADGSAITPGNFSSTGGQSFAKPDFTAADGGSTSVPGFTSFYGTSAAAPTAAAIAALIKSYNPALTPAQIRTLLSSTALDIEGAGYDRTSGSGIIMALAAIQAAPAPDALTVTGSFLDGSGHVGGPFNPTSTTYTLKNNGGTSLNWTAAKNQSWVSLSSTSGALAAGASTTVTVSLTGGINAFSAGSYADTVTFTNTTSSVAQTRALTLAVTPTPPANDNFANAITLAGVTAQATGVSTTYATKEAGEPNHAQDTGGHSVWWKWVAPGNSTVTASTIGSNFDTLLGVYTGSAVNALTTIAYNDDAPGYGVGTVSSTTFTAVAGTTYYFAVDGWQGATGTVTFNLAYTPPPINDFSNDGKADIIWQNTVNGERGFWLMNGTAFASWVDIGAVPTAWRIAATADFNGDGQTDLLWENTSTGDRGFWLMNGTTFSSWVDIGIISTSLRIVAAADFNGDGKPDILWENTATGKRVIWFMNGTTFVSSYNLGLVGTDWHIVAAADFNGDGKPDILWENSTTGERYLWFMSGTTYVSGQSLGVVGTSWHIAAVADYNGDGKPDILWENTATGERGFWLMNGAAYSSWQSVGVISTDWRIVP